MTEAMKTAANTVLKDVNPELFRHPGENIALGRLEKAPGFAKLLELMSDHGGGKAERLVELASMVRVGPGVYPELDSLWSKTLEDFGVGDVPLHISASAPRAWSIKGGHAGPRVIVAANLLDDLADDDMAVLLAMAAGSVRLGNVNNIAAGEFLRWVQDYYGVIGAPAIMLSWALEEWRRFAAMSADRAALLYCGAGATQAFLAGLAGAGSKAWGGIADEARLRLQGVEAVSRGQDRENNRWRRFFVAMNRHNSAALTRRLDLAEWAASGAPEMILSGKATTPEDLSMGSETTDSPGIAYWGEFASGGADEDEGDSSIWREAADELRDKAEKGINSFLKAGEAFFKTLRDEGKS